MFIVKNKVGNVYRQVETARERDKWIEEGYVDVTEEEKAKKAAEEKAKKAAEEKAKKDAEKKAKKDAEKAAKAGDAQ